MTWKKGKVRSIYKFQITKTVFWKRIVFDF